ncbi:MAG: type III secretion system inner rod subunit SctI [Mycoplasma sp.]
MVKSIEGVQIYKDPLIISKVDAKDIGSIDSLFIEAISNKVSVMQDVKLSINNALSDPTLISDPASLARVQAMMADYSLNISLFEKIAQSGIKAVDTLVKSWEIYLLLFLCCFCLAVNRVILFLMSQHKNP